MVALIVFIAVMVCAPDMTVFVEVIVIGVDIIVVAIVLNFFLPTWYLVDVLSDVSYVNLFVMLDILPGVGIEVLPVVNVNGLVVVISAVEFRDLSPLDEFSRWPAFDGRPRALLDCNRVLQTLMPSYHV